MKERIMKQNRARSIFNMTVCIIWLSIICAISVSAADSFKPLPQDLEMELALSALPPHLRENATVYTLHFKNGFKVVRKGTNGFNALVARTSSDVYRGSWPYTEYPNDVLIPIAYDGAGAKANMRPFFDIAKMRAEGVPAKEAKTTIMKRYHSGAYHAPARAGISYMLSPVLRAYLDPDKHKKIETINFPHYMFYSPGVSNQDIGGSLSPGAHPFGFRPGVHGFIVIRAGEKEIADINKEYAGMIAKLCKFQSAFCLPQPGKQE